MAHDPVYPCRLELLTYSLQSRAADPRRDISNSVPTLRLAVQHRQQRNRPARDIAEGWHPTKMCGPYLREVPELAVQRPTTERLQPGISRIDVSLRSLTWPHIPRKFTR